MSNEDRTDAARDRADSVHNRIEGGRHHTVIQAGAISSIEIHGAARDERGDIEDPVIATVDLPSLGGQVVEADPPRAVMKSDVRSPAGRMQAAVDEGGARSPVRLHAFGITRH